MPDFGFYREVYGGGLGEDVFLALLPGAEARVGEFERVYTVCYPRADGRQRAVCAVLDELALTRRAADEAEGIVTGISLGSLKTSYAGLDPAALVQGAEGRYYRAMQVYADLYRGLNRRGKGVAA